MESAEAKLLGSPKGSPREQTVVSYSAVSEGSPSRTGDTPQLCRAPHGIETNRVVGVYNRLSGERAAANTVMRGLFAVLGPENCVELTPDVFQRPDPLKNIIRKRTLTPKAADPSQQDSRGTVLIAGGDGTISFVMSVIDALLEEFRRAAIEEERREEAVPGATDAQPLDESILPILVPAVGVLPMGTGNDFSNSMGYGTGYTKNKCCVWCCCCPDPITEHIFNVLSSPVVKLDRWHAQYEEEPAPIDGVPQPRKLLLSLTANNYIGVGIDSYLLYEFDRLRKAHAGCFRNRTVNKAWYGMIGIRALCGVERVNGAVEVIVDGVPRKVPPKSKGIIISNLDSYAGGGLLWQVPRAPPPGYPHLPVSINDGLVEVSAIGGVWQQAFVQLGCGGDKIAQGKKIEFIVHKLMPYDGSAPQRVPVHHHFQYDGEPLGNFSDVPVTSKIHVTVTHHIYPSYVRSSSKSATGMTKQ